MRNAIIGTVGKVSLTDRAAFTYYRKNAKYRKVSNTPHITDHTKVITLFYSKIAEKLIENEGGVFIKGLGYFTIIVNPKKQIVEVPYGDKKYANFQTGNYLYLPTFFGVTKNNPLINFWVMDRAFNRKTVREKLHEALISGKRYKTYISTLASLYLIKKKI